MRRTRWQADLRALVDALFKRRRLRERVEEELRFHVETRIDPLSALRYE